MKQIKNILKYVVFLGLGILLVWLSLRSLTDEDIIRIKESLKTANYTYLALAILAGLFSHVVRAIRWNMLIQPLNHSPKLPNTIMAVIVGYLANIAVPRLGEVTRCGVLNKYEKVPIESGIGTVITERILDSLMLLSLFVFILIVQFDIFYSTFEKNILNPLSSKVGGVTNLIIIIAVAGFISMAVLYVFYVKFIKKNKDNSSQEESKFKSIINRFMKGVISVKDVKNKPLFITLTIGIWMVYSLSTYFSYRVLAETAHLGFTESLALVVWTAFGYIIVQGGVGAVQIICMEVLFLYGVERSFGLTMGWISWLSQTAAIVVFGLLSLVILPIYNRDKKIN